MIVYGLFDAVFQLVFGVLIQVVGHLPIFITGAIINYIVIGGLFNWVPQTEERYIFFIIAAAWGIADAAWQSQKLCKFTSMFTIKVNSFHTVPLAKCMIINVLS